MQNADELAPALRALLTREDASDACDLAVAEEVAACARAHGTGALAHPVSLCGLALCWLETETDRSERRRQRAARRDEERQRREAAERGAAERKAKKSKSIFGSLFGGKTKTK